MKEQIKFKIFDKDLSQLNTLEELHRSVYYDTFFNNKLIYFDGTFQKYLNKLVNDKDHYFFVIEKNSTILGFVHLRTIDDFLFLNNISVSSEYAGLGLGKKLLSYSIKEVLKSNLNVSILKLDVFESNHRALNWYKKLSFVEEKTTNWYQFNKVILERGIDFTNKPDFNGFPSLFVNSHKIATIINNNLILHDSNYIYHMDIKQYQSVQTNDNSFKTNSLFNIATINYKLIDASIRMIVDIEKIIEKLENA